MASSSSYSPLYNAEESKRTALFSAASNDESSSELSTALLDGSSGSSSGAAAATLAPPVLHLEENRKGLHATALVVSTLWWYLFASQQILTEPPVEFFGLGSGVITAMATYVTLSQFIVYGFLFQLTRATSLRQGQFWIVLCILCCVPADTLVVLFDPAGSQLATVGAFGLVTMMYGLFLAHYLRLAAEREEQQNAAVLEATADTAIATTPEDQLALQQQEQLAIPSGGHHHHELHPDGVLGELKDYRPPKKLQSFHMAVSFTRSFVAFTLAVAAFRDALGHGSGDDASTFALLLGSCALVVVHTAVEMTLTTVFPGSDLEEYPNFLKFEALIYGLHIAASSVIAHESPFGDSIWDQLLYSWLFGNATANFFERLQHLFRDVDFDAGIGLSRE